MSIVFLACLAAGGGFKPPAYLDPGSGSYVLQFLLATFVGAAFLVKVYWAKIKSFFSGRASSELEAPDPAEPER
jgi:hypothetical protein